MTRKIVYDIISKSVIDRAFAKQLMENPEKALKEYELTPEEIHAIKAMQVEFDQKYIKGNIPHPVEKIKKNGSSK
ncbi:MAG: Os1348 family NHLP clan protein [Candidatus Ancaeobacter aquaticus]|nr:Os1348 family NHLP clan protein [Candidatus Ancaeobacter aquaticus]